MITAPTAALALGLATWAGPGAAPCDPDTIAGPAPTQCTLEWAMGEWRGNLPAETLARLRDAMREPARRYYVFQGDVIEELGEAGPRMLHDPRIYTGDEPVPLMGWRGGSYIVGIIGECGNPVVVLRPLEQAASPVTAPTYAPVTREPVITTSARGTSLGWGGGGASVAVDDDDCGCLEPPGEVPPPVPLPASVWTLMAALGGLFYLKWRTK